MTLPESLGAPGAPARSAPPAGCCSSVAATRALHAVNTDTGRDVWSAALRGGRPATPMTYRAKNGRQFVVIAVGGRTTAELVAFALQNRSSAGRVRSNVRPTTVFMSHDLAAPDHVARLAQLERSAPRCPRLRPRAACSSVVSRPEHAEEDHLLVAVARRRVDRAEPDDRLTAPGRSPRGTRAAPPAPATRPRRRCRPAAPTGTC